MGLAKLINSKRQRGAIGITPITMTSSEESVADNIEFKKSSDFRHVKGPAFDIFWVKNPEEESKVVGGEFGTEKIGAFYKSDSKNEWEGFVFQSGLGLQPLDSWKERIAREASTASGARVDPRDVRLEVRLRDEGKGKDSVRIEKRPARND